MSTSSLKLWASSPAARAHAKSGEGTTISGTLGKGEAVDKAMDRFALIYADQTEKDRTSLVKAMKSERVEAMEEEES